MAADLPDPGTPARPEVPLVPLDRDDAALVRSWAVSTSLTFLGPVPSEGDVAWRRQRTLDHRITVGVDDGQVVATFRSFDTDLTLPGGHRVPVDAVSGVTVLSTHRRRGLLSRWMAEEVRRAGEAGLCASVLVASEAPIYGRFGYGPASAWCTWKVDARRARWHGSTLVGGTFRMVDGQDWARVAPELHERVARRHPGAIGREQNLFRWIGGLVPDITDEGKNGRRFLLHRDAGGEVDGSVVFSIGEGASWNDGATVKVGDLLAVDDRVEAALVRFLGEIDFVTEVEVADQPPTWAVPWSLADPRAASSGQVTDGLQVRLHDVPAALSARSYAVPGTLVLEVTDPVGQTTGTYRLEAGEDGTATCARVEDPDPDVVVEVGALGSLWLGGSAPSAAALASSGRLRPREAATLARLHALFSWPVPAHVLTHF